MTFRVMLVLGDKEKRIPLEGIEIQFLTEGEARDVYGGAEQIIIDSSSETRVFKGKYIREPG